MALLDVSGIEIILGKSMSLLSDGSKKMTTNFKQTMR